MANIFRQVSKILLGISAVVAVQASALAAPQPWNGRVYDVAQARFLQADEIREGIRNFDILVLGEKHDTPTVQLQQSAAIELALQERPQSRGRWVLGWEFLNRRDQLQIDSLWSEFVTGSLAGPDFMDRLMGKGRNRSYLPILEAAARHSGALRGLNLARDEKAPILTGGLASLPAGVVPPDFEMGGSFYRERFDAVMGGGHAAPEKMQRYFEAQCLTDDVMAFELLRGAFDFRIMVNGSFHSDYFDAAVARLRAREAGHRIMTIRFIDASDYREADLVPDLQLADPVRDARYGSVADWVWFAGEPSAD